MGAQMSQALLHDLQRQHSAEAGFNQTEVISNVQCQETVYSNGVVVGRAHLAFSCLPPRARLTSLHHHSCLFLLSTILICFVYTEGAGHSTHTKITREPVGVGISSPTMLVPGIKLRSASLTADGC